MTFPRRLLPAAFLAAILPALADDEGAPKKKDDRYPAGDPLQQTAEAALKTIAVAPGLKAEVWASEPLLANPVAFTFDLQGRAYVAETNRRRTSVPDIRKYEAWTIENLALRSVDQRVAFFKSKFPDTKPIAPTKDRPDLNNDGQFDWRDLEVESEKVRIIEDSNRDGKADQSHVLAEGFNTIATGVAAGIATHDGDVFFTCTPDLWKIKSDGTKEKLFTGFGVHTAYSGHDMHGTKIGPDGKLYWSIADCGAHVVDKNGKVLVDVPDCGAIFRCNTEGTKLELVAKGLRNPQSLAFNEVGDLFTGDNNADGGDKARWIYVVEGADYGWRIGWQFLPKLGAWNSEGMWHLDAAERHITILPPAGHVGHGPAGIVYYPGTGLPDTYRDHFFYADFPGGIRSFQLTPKGASYTVSNPGDILMDNSPQKMAGKVLWNLYPSDVAFAPGGGLYVLDWIQGWEKTGKGRIYRVFDSAADASAIVQETKNLLNEGFAKKSSDQLTQLLGHADQRIRLGAQFELVKRKDTAALVGVALGKHPRVKRLHAIWGAGQLAEADSKVYELITKLAKDDDSEVRAQWARIARQAYHQGNSDLLVGLLADPEPRVRFFAANALCECSDPLLRTSKAAAKGLLPALFQALKTDDPYLRHAVARTLGSYHGEDHLRKGMASFGKDTAKGGLLTLQWQHGHGIIDGLRNPDALIATEAARMIHDNPQGLIGPSDLAHLANLANTPGLTEPLWRRAVNASYLLGTSESATLLARVGTNPKLPVAERVFALESLAIWNAPFGRDRITGLWRDLPPRSEAKGAREAAIQIVPVLLADPDESIRLAAAQLAGATSAKESETVLLEAVSDPNAGGKVRAAALRALGEMDSAKLSDAVKVALGDHDRTLLEAARKLAARSSPADAVKVNSEVLGKGSIREQQEAIATIGQQPIDEADRVIADQLELLAKGKLPAGLALDLLEVAAKRTNSEVKARLAAWQQSRNGSDPLANWHECMDGGDAKVGREIFFEKAEAACLRCHKVKGEGGDIGPDLADISKRYNREQILRSIVDPNAAIAPGYESVILTLNDGNMAAGILSKEEPSVITLKSLTDGSPQKIEKVNIKDRASMPSAMPPGLGDVVGKRGLRDLVEYLATLK
jgi:quinoprotein glucose dehydrogenase